VPGRQTAPEDSAAQVPPVPGPLPTAEVWLTTPDQTAKLSPLGVIPFRGGGQYDTSGGPIPGPNTLPPVGAGVPTGIVDGPTIEIDPTRSYQTMDGFGAAITDSSAAVLSSLSTPVLEATMRSLFDPTVGDGLSYLRQPFGASDFVVGKAYTYDDVPAGTTDYSLKRFSIAHDLKQIIPLLLKAKQLNPQLGVVATPWSPPAWMKTSHSLVGGRLIDSPRIYDAYASYLVKALKAYTAAGVTVNAITVQNEPQNRKPSGYPGTDLPSWQEAKVIEKLGPKIAAAKLGTKILAYDHNWSEHPDDVRATPSDEHRDDNAYDRNVLASGASKWIAGTAYHCYYGDPGSMSVMHAAHPDKDIYFTECSGVQSANPANTFNDSLRFGARNLIIGATRNWAKTVIDWNLALDQNGGPHVGGCSTCTGVVTVGAGGVVTNNVEYYTLGHIARFVQPGAVRIASSSFGTAAYNGQLMDVAFRNPDGTTVLIVHNENDNPTTFGVTENGAGFRYAIPGGALATFVWAGDAGQAMLRPVEPRGWKATANPSAPDDPCCFDSTAAKAIDDDASTRWATGTAQQPGMRFAVDFGRAQPIQQVVLDSGGAQGDAPTRFDAEVSTDGRVWTRVVKDGTGQRQITAITLAGKPIRYLRVTLTGQTGSWWSVADVRAYVAAR
jgi:glucosylceramidase